MRMFLILIILISGCAASCECKNERCGTECKNQCDGIRCIPGEPCCEKCTCKK